jgi:hypothetical protein
MLAQSLIAASAVIILLLGTVHLVYTFTSNKFSPRDQELEARLKLISPIISKETTMWKAWVGFNASHSLGAILFGAVYGYLAIFHYSFLLQSSFLAILGVILLVGYLVLAKLYWFSVPFRGIAFASVLYVLGFAIVLA